MAATVLAIAQSVAALRVVSRMAQTARGVRVERRTATDSATVTAIVPVLDEEHRLEPLLRQLTAQGATLAAILIVDGGSTDATFEVAARYLRRDARIRYLCAAPVPAGWNGKAWGLARGLAESDVASQWILTIDADVRPESGLVTALLAHAQRTGDDAFSVATAQEVAAPLDAVVHPAMLTTLVYRYGLPGGRAASVARVQANGQCFFARRDALLASDAFAYARASRCEDVTAARRLFCCGYTVGFYESDRLASVRMYDDWRSLVANWPRSLPARDGYVRQASVIGLAEIVLAQALPLPLLALLRSRGSARTPLFVLNGVLTIVRLATLAGTRRAYRRPGWAYWLSPLADLPVAALIIASALRRTHHWRGRTLVPDGG